VRDVGRALELSGENLPRNAHPAITRFNNPGATAPS
jgi:hypothetical protein